MKQRIVTRTVFVILAGTILALAGIAHADAKMQQPHRAKKGIVNTTVATNLGAVTLEPGSYEVKEVNSTAGIALRFTKLTENFQVPEGLPVYEWEVVAEVNCTVEPLQSKTEHTGFLLASDTGKAIGLKIRGSEVEYLF